MFNSVTLKPMMLGKTMRLKRGFDHIEDWLMWLAWKEMVKAGYCDKDTKNLNEIALEQFGKGRLS